MFEIFLFQLLTKTWKEIKICRKKSRKSVRVGLIQINGGGLNLGSYGPGGGGWGLKNRSFYGPGGGWGLKNRSFFVDVINGWHLISINQSFQFRGWFGTCNKKFFNAIPYLCPQLSYIYSLIHLKYPQN